MNDPANTVVQTDIDDILSRAKVEVTKLGEKTCCVHVRLANGFEMTETAACVDPANYSESIGRSIGMKRIADRLWQLEGWRLQCRLFGEP
jgi:hypothetical protein